MSRHPAVQHMLDTLKPNPNLQGKAWQIAFETHKLALSMADQLEDGQELTTGLRKLREAKDCFVIQSLIDAQELGNTTT